MKYFLLLFCLIYSGLAEAQKTGQARIDSLEAELPKIKIDSNGARTMLRLAKAYDDVVGPQKAIPIANKALDIAEKIGWKAGISLIDNNLALMLGDSGNVSLSRTYFERSYKMDQESGDQIGMVRNLNSIARTHLLQANYPLAMNYYMKGLKLAEEIKDLLGICELCNGISAIYYEQNHYEKAKDYALKSLATARIANATFTIGKASQFLGAIQMELKDTAGARQYLFSALKTFRNASIKKGVASVLVDLSLTEGTNYLKAIGELKESFDISDLTNPLSMSTLSCLIDLAEQHLQLAEHSSGPLRETYMAQADGYLKEAMDRGVKSKNDAYLGQVYKTKEALEEMRGNYKEALNHYRKFTSINDSIYSQDKKNEISDLEGKYQLEKKDQELSLRNLLVERQKKVQIGLAIVLILFGIFGFLFYRQSRIQKRTNTTLITLNAKLDEANKVKAKFFGILSHDLRSPIAQLIHFLQLQKSDPELMDESQKASIQDEITGTADELLSNMESMLFWSKDQMEHFKPNKKQIPVSHLFDYIRKFFSNPGSIEIRFQDVPDLLLYSDENYLNTIMQNLTSNAIKALAKSGKAAQGGVIEWAARKAGDQVILSITDNGPGMAKEQSVAFTKDDVTVNERTGFGLYLVKDLARTIQCLVAVKSELGVGTTFTLTV